MKLEFITKQDLDLAKGEIIDIVKSLTNNTKPKQWLRSKEVKEKLNISNGTLQNMRINRTIPYSFLGPTIYYDSNEIDKILNDNKIVN